MQYININIFYVRIPRSIPHDQKESKKQIINYIFELTPKYTFIFIKTILYV